MTIRFMTIEEAKQKVAEKYGYKELPFASTPWDVFRFSADYEKFVEQYTDEAWQMVFESEKENFKKILESKLQQKDNVAKGLYNFIKQLKAENERLRKEEKQQGTPLGNLQYDSDYLEESCNRSLWDLAALEDAFKAALFKADANIDFDIAWNNYKKHILKIK